MSLNWNLGRIKDHSTVCWVGEEMNPVTHSLLFSTMIVDMGEITEENADEFYFRTEMASKVGGPPMRRVKEDSESGFEGVDYSYEDIRKHIGLTTNVFTVSRAAFLKKMAKCLERDIEAQIRHEHEKGE